MVTDDGSLIKAEIDQELVELEQKYRTPRLCKVIDSDKENEIPKGTFIVAITEKNFVRKLPDGSKVNVVRKDKPKHILKVDNAENILIFDNKGKVFSLPVSKIPICDKTNAGTDVRILIRKLTSEITAVYYEPIFTKIAKSTNKHYLVMLTKQNVIKKLDIKDFTNVTPSGLIYTKLKDQTDEVVSIILAQHNADVLITNDKKVLRAPLKEVSEMKRNAVGVRAMSGNLFMNSMSIIYPKTKYLVAVTKDGKVNKFAQDTFACHKRGTGGNNVVKLSDNDALYGIYGVDDGDHMHVLTANGVVDIDTTSIKTKSTVAAGTKMIKSEILKIDIVR
jgi:DNA gyrase subunit A